MPKKHSLDLLTNSISYFREAVGYVQRDTEDTQHWKFAITHAVQAMELAFKEFLRRKHPVFIWESIDRPEKTVSLRLAVERLRNPAIGALAISDAEKKKIEKAIELRNQLTHYGFEFEHEYIELKFAELFGFMIFFYKTHLGLEPDDFIDDAQHQKIVGLVKTRKELLSRAEAFIKENESDVWQCQNCAEDTFLVDESQCCLCHHEDDVVFCEWCGERNLSSQIIDVTQYFEWDHDEGRMRLVDDFGITHVACPECIGSVRDKIEVARRDRYYDDMEREHYARSS